MSTALAILSGLAGLGALVWSVSTFKRGSRGMAAPIAYLGLIALTWATMAVVSEGYHRSPPVTKIESSRPVEESSGDYVTSDTCRSCHPGEYHSWHRSYHRTMTQLATDESVLGDFDSDFVGTFPGLEVSMSRENDGFYVDYKVGSPQTIRRREKRRVVMTTGSHHYQVYWTDQSWLGDEKEGDRTVWLAPFVYHLEEKQWLPRYATFITPTVKLPEYHRWNQTCSRCHSTQGAAKYDPVSDTHDTRAVEFGISCESCHGPGEEHIRINRNPLGRYEKHRDESVDEPIVNPMKLDHRRSAEVCGRCHSYFMSHSHEKRLEWNEEGQSFRPGDVLADHLHIHQWGQESAPDFEPIDDHYLESRFWSDGMAKVAGREYNGLLETPCFQEGEMSCLTCHEMHRTEGDPQSMAEWANDQLGPKMRTNAACLQCHESFNNPETLAQHTHHLPDSSGSSCYNCHMPRTTYGLLQGIRSHQIDSPSVKSSLDTGRPNACNLCHLDKTLAWTGDHLSQWYAQPKPTLNEDQQEISASLLWLLTGDAGQRGIVASGFSQEDARQISGTRWMPPFLAQLQTDPYHAVQIIANRSLRSLDGYDDISRYPKTRKAGVEALRIWEDTHSDLPANPALLIDSEGKVARDELLRLLKMRDDRPVHLSE